MMIPIILVLGTAFWILTSVVKYFYFNKIKVNYPHKLDPKVLDEIRKPSKEVLERIEKRKRDRKEKRGEEASADSFKDVRATYNSKEDSPGPTRNVEMSTGNGNKRNTRPMTLFEEIDMLKEKAQKQQSKHIRDAFDDPLSRLYRDIQKLENAAT